MLHKFRLLLATASTAILLVACTSEINEDASHDISSIDTVETLSIEMVSHENDIEDANSINEQTSEQTSNEETTTEEKIKEKAKADDATLVETNAASEDVQAEEVALDELRLVEQAAVEKILSVTNLNIEEHTYSFDQAKGYIEVEIREITEDEVTPLVGLFRYNPKTKEVLISDYLTGEFIPYENLN